MKTTASLIFISLIVLFTSCEKKKEYKANVSVINNTESQVTNFSFEADNTNFSKTFETIDPTNTESFEVTWIGERSGLLWRDDNPDIFMIITYNIGDRPFDIHNGEGVQLITNGSSVEITITNEGYNIE